MPGAEMVQRFIRNQIVRTIITKQVYDDRRWRLHPCAMKGRTR